MRILIMTEETDIGVITTLMDRMTNQRLPRLLEMKACVDKGDRLTQSDIDFLEQAFKDAQGIRQYIARNPEYEKIAANVAHLYKEVTEKALRNEQAVK